MRLAKAAVVVILEALELDPESLEEPQRLRRVQPKNLDVLRSAVTDEHPIGAAKLVTLRVTSEIVVILEDENL